MAMVSTNRRKHWLIAYSLIAPFLAIFVLAFGYPTWEVVRLSFTDAPLIGDRGSAGR